MKKTLLLALVLAKQIVFSQEIKDCINNSNDEFIFFTSLIKKPSKLDCLTLNERITIIKRLDHYIDVFHSKEIKPLHFSDPSRIYFSYILNDEYNQLDKLWNDRNLSFDSIQNKYKVNIETVFINLLDLDDSNNNMVKLFVEEIDNPFTLELLYSTIDDIYFLSNSIPKFIEQENLNIIKAKIESTDKKTYVFYENYNSKTDFFKGFEMYHENDVFSFFLPKTNQDRELTGGFKFSIITDQLKWRWLRLGNKKEDNILTYQTISMLGSGYTPYIRYRNNYALNDTLQSFDRPFSSFMCIERAKHRTWSKGLVRHQGEFQIGAMGISQGRKIQAQLHKDLITSSQFVRGWDNQIASGGRMVFQLNHKLDLLLFSNTNRYQTVFRPNTYKVFKPKKLIGTNLFSESEFRIGTINTDFSLGLRFSTLDFLNQSGNQMIKRPENTFCCIRFFNKDEFSFKFDIGLKYKYVFHNSTLQGLGIFKTFDEDPYDNEPIDVYYLTNNEIEKNIFTFDFGLNVKFRKTTVFYRQYIYTLEYKSRLNNVDLQNPYFISLLDPKDLEFYQNKVIKEQQSFLNKKIFGRQIYSYGTLGISWLI